MPTVAAALSTFIDRQCDCLLGQLTVLFQIPVIAVDGGPEVAGWLGARRPNYEGLWWCTPD
jgi:hypothetical protein